MTASRSESAAQYTLIRSDRKSLSLEITRELEVVVRAPKRLPKSRIDAFVRAKADWLAEHMELQRQRADWQRDMDEGQLRALAEQTLPRRVEHYAAVMGLEPAGVKITGAKTRFGSCSAKNSLCFSWRLMAYPREAQDYVVVHELAHIAQKNHGPGFYAVVASVMPDYKQRRALLKK